MCTSLPGSRRGRVCGGGRPCLPPCMALHRRDGQSEDDAFVSLTGITCRDPGFGQAFSTFFGGHLRSGGGWEGLSLGPRGGQSQGGWQVVTEQEGGKGCQGAVRFGRRLTGPGMWASCARPLDVHTGDPRQYLGPSPALGCRSFKSRGISPTPVTWSCQWPQLPEPPMSLCIYMCVHVWETEVGPV